MSVRIEATITLYIDCIEYGDNQWIIHFNFTENNEVEIEYISPSQFGGKELNYVLNYVEMIKHELPPARNQSLVDLINTVKEHSTF
jgi:hypothetical protein